jgi:hypothetical protein
MARLLEEFRGHEFHELASETGCAEFYEVGESLADDAEGECYGARCDVIF